MLWLRPLQYPFSKQSVPQARVWAFKSVVCIPQDLCIEHRLDWTGVPVRNLRGFLQMQLSRLSPFEQTGSHVEIHGRTIHVWLWNQKRTTSAGPTDSAWEIPESRLLRSATSTTSRLSLATALGALWWQRAQKPVQRSAISLPLAAALAATVGAAGFVAYWAHSAWTKQSALELAQQRILVARKAAHAQIEAQQTLAQWQSKAVGLAEFDSQDQVAQVLACTALALGDSALTIRDIDLRFGNLQATLASDGPVELEHAQQSAKACVLLIEPVVEPAGEPKSARLSARFQLLSGVQSPALPRTDTARSGS